MLPKPKAALVPNTYAYESEPMVKPTGFREYDARWLFGKEINLMGIQALGLGLGTLIHELGVKPELVTAHDFRGYSASIKMALVKDAADLRTQGLIGDDFSGVPAFGQRPTEFVGEPAAARAEDRDVHRPFSSRRAMRAGRRR